MENKQKEEKKMFRHFEQRKDMSEGVLRGVLSMLGGIIVIGLLVLIITLSG